jgi:DNA-binding NarL/FixJ family response regulator
MNRVRTPVRGNLTPLESEIIAMIAAGEQKKTIAPKIGLSVRTVEAHVARIFRKLGARNSAHAAAIWTREQCEAGA